MKEIITSHLSEMKLKVFIDYLDSYSCEIYYHKGILKLGQPMTSKTKTSC